MKTKFFVIFLAVSFLALGQETHSQPPQPGPEHQKLAGLVGTWTSEGEDLESPFGPAQKWSFRIKAEWFPGRFAVVRHIEGKGSLSGQIFILNVFAYAAKEQTHTWYEIDNYGFTGLVNAAISEGVLKIEWGRQVKGKTYKMRGTLKGLGSDQHTYTLEYSEDGSVWKVAFRSTETRVKSN